MKHTLGRATHKERKDQTATHSTTKFSEVTLHSTSVTARSRIDTLTKSTETKFTQSSITTDKVSTTQTLLEYWNTIQSVDYSIYSHRHLGT
jgi:hypothetical protein